MEAVVKDSLKTETLTPFGRGGGGCINEGRSFVKDDRSKIYVKYKADKKGARRMFEGEFASLDAIMRTGQIRVPEPMVVEDYPAGEFFVNSPLPTNTPQIMLPILPLKALLNSNSRNLNFVWIRLSVGDGAFGSSFSPPFDSHRIWDSTRQTASLQSG